VKKLYVLVYGGRRFSAEKKRYNRDCRVKGGAESDGVRWCGLGGCHPGGLCRGRDDLQDPVGPLNYPDDGFGGIGDQWEQHPLEKGRVGWGKERSKQDGGQAGQGNP